MKKLISLFLTLAVIATACVFPMSASAEDVDFVNINGKDRFEVMGIIEKFDAFEDGDVTQVEYVCGRGAGLILLEDNVTALVTLSVHDAENGSSSSYIAPFRYSDENMNEYGQIFDLPEGTVYTFEEEGMYYLDIQFADGATVVGYITVDYDYVPVDTNVPVVPEVSESIPVVSKAQTIQVEEEWADVDAYNIFDNNYIKLRDFAYYYSMFCPMSDKWFDVTWDGEKNAINLVTGKEYTPVGGEGELNVGVNANAVLSSSAVFLNGEYIPLTAYNINDNNYFKLRDLCEALDISISWWGVQQIIYINSGYPYGTEFGEIAPDAM